MLENTNANAKRKQEAQALEWLKFYKKHDRYWQFWFFNKKLISNADGTFLAFVSETLGLWHIFRIASWSCTYVPNPCSMKTNFHSKSFIGKTWFKLKCESLTLLFSLLCVTIQELPRNNTRELDHRDFCARPWMPHNKWYMYNPTLTSQTF